MSIYRELGVVPLINAVGSVTILGGSIILPEVTDAMSAASRHFVDLHELHAAAGSRLAELLEADAAHVCAGSSAGITLMAAACMTGTDPHKIKQLPDTTDLKRRFVVQRSHRHKFDQALLIAGGEFLEVSPNANELRNALQSEQVAGMFCSFAWYCGGEELPFPRVVELAHEANIPVIVDAAAQVPPVENFFYFQKQGADLVVFSGGKTLCGPQASGFILGRRDLIQACALHDSPNVGIGRGMKVGKEEIVGLVKAVELYLDKDHAAEASLWEQRIQSILQEFAELPFLIIQREIPSGIGYQVPYVSISWDETQHGLRMEQIVQALNQGSPRIAMRIVAPPLAPRRQLWICVHTLQNGEEFIVARRLKSELTRFSS